MKFKGTFYGKIMKLFSGTAASQLVWILAMVVVSRLYSAEDLGEQQLFIATASICSIVGTGRYEMAISIPKYNYQAKQLCIFSLLLAVIYATLLFLILLVFDFFLPSVSQKYLGSSMLFVPVLVVELCLYLIFYNYLLRTQLYRVAVNGLLLFPVAYLLFIVICRHIDMFIPNLIAAIIIARGVECAYYGIHLRKVLNFNYSKHYCYLVINKGREYNDFPKYMLLGDFIDTLKSNIIPFFITLFWGKTATGYFSMASQCLAAPSSLVAKSVGDVFRQEGSRLYEFKNTCEEFYLKNLRLCSVYSLIVCVCVYFISPIIIDEILGERWEETCHYMQWMLPMTFFTLISSPLSNMYTIAREQKKYMRVQICFLIGSVICFLTTGLGGSEIKNALLFLGIVFASVSCYSLYGGLKISRRDIR